MRHRIAHVISTPKGIGGAERVLAALARGGSSRGFEQIVLNPFGGDPSDLRDVLRVPVVSKRGDRLVDLPGLRRWLRMQLKAFKPDLVHSHLFHASVVVASLPSAGIPRVMSHQHGATLGRAGRHFEQALDRWAGARFTRVAACSEFVRCFLLNEYGYPSQQVVTILNGWEGSPLPRRGRRTSMTVVCIANFRPEKGHSVLLSAFAQVAHVHPSTRLALAGGGPLRAQLQRQARDLGIEERINFLGTVENVWPLLSEADVLVLPSLYESLGIVAIEAMAAGLPVVASNVGGIPELIQPGINGELVEPGDAAALSRGLDAVLSNPKKRLAFGEAGRLRAEHLTMSATVQRYFDLYSELWDLREAD